MRMALCQRCILMKPGAISAPSPLTPEIVDGQGLPAGGLFDPAQVPVRPPIQAARTYPRPLSRCTLLPMSIRHVDCPQSYSSALFDSLRPKMVSENAGNLGICAANRGCHIVIRRRARMPRLAKNKQVI